MRAGVHFSLLNPKGLAVRNWVTALFFSLWSCLTVCKAETQLPCQAHANEKNGSRFCVRLKFENGKTVIDQKVFTPNSALRSHPEATRDELVAALEIALEKLDKPYRFAMADDEKKRDDAGKLDDELTKQIRSFSGDWDSFADLFIRWTAALETRLPADQVLFENGLYMPLKKIHYMTPLLFEEFPGDGTLSFSVADLIDPDHISLQLPGIMDEKKRAYRVQQLRNRLKPLRGSLWYQSKLESRIKELYEALDLVPSIEFNARMGRISIIEAKQIARIVLPNQKEEAGSIDKALYVLLAHRDFRNYVRNRHEICRELNNVDSEAPFQALDYVEHLGRPPFREPYLNPSQLQIQQLLLAQLGLVVTVETNVTRRDENPQIPIGIDYVDLRVRKRQDGETNRGDAAKAAAPLADDKGHLQPHLQESERHTDFAKSTPILGKHSTPPAGGNDQKLKDQKNYVGFGIQYKPGQGLHFFGLGQRSRLRLPFREGSVSGKLGRHGNNLISPSLNYFADYLLFSKLHRRLSLQFNGSSAVETNRFLSGRSVDERRTGGMARVEFEPFRDWSGSMLKFYAEAHRDTVSLSKNGLTVRKQNLTSVDLGNLYLFESVEAAYPLRIRLEPHLRVGLGLADSQSRFARLTLVGSVHRDLPARFAVEVTSRYEWAADNTPLLELPSLGGAASVRGFRRDDAVGRRLWSMQNEMWTPMPLPGESKGGIKDRLRKHVKLAGFGDVGGTGHAVGSQPGLRVGLGTGLRIIFNPLVMKIDYAYGLGNAATGGSRGKLYFNVNTHLPF